MGYQGQEYESKVGLYGFGLRLYDQRLGRWLSADPYGQHWSPYLAMSNNPVSFVDADGGWSRSLVRVEWGQLFDNEEYDWYSYNNRWGAFNEWSGSRFNSNSSIQLIGPNSMIPDDYVYLNAKGEEIGRIPDASVNKVTIIKDENLQKFDDLPYGRNSIARANEMGVTYDLSGILSLYKSSASDIVKIDPKTHMDASGNKIEDEKGNAKQGIAMEHGASLKLQNGEVVAVGNVKGTPTNVILDTASQYNDIVGTAHTHPNEGKGATILNSKILALFNSSGPSEGYDLGTQGAPKKGYYNIVIDKKNIYFYNKDLQNNKVIILSRKKI